MPLRHLLDTPCPLDAVRLLCGPTLNESAKRCRGRKSDEQVTGTVGLVTCIPCLRAHAVRQECELAARDQEIQRLREEVEGAKRMLTLEQARAMGEP